MTGFVGVFTNPILNILFSYYLVFTYVLQDTLNYENVAQVKIINGIVEIKYKVYGYLVCLAIMKTKLNYNFSS